MTTTTFHGATPRSPKSCIYCGHVGMDVRGWRALGGRYDYACMDVEACGARLRAQRTTPLPDDDLPF